ncbi:MAG: ABC transporter ATP-binding protein [Patescibacteria group bacterium]
MLKLDNIIFDYDHKSDNTDLLLRNFNLEIFDGEFLSLVGPSGCGKTTLVNIIAGYLKPFSGNITINQAAVASPSKDRVVINQENDLFEWMTVLENMKIVSQNKILIEQCLRLTYLSDFIHYYPRQLSGGMKKKLSLARALAADPKFIIMDEPFGSLDNQIKEKLHTEVLKIVKQSKKTILLVTHDVEEALFLSDRILLLSGKPVIIKKEIKIPFNYPRSESLKDSVEFNKLRSAIRQDINHSRSSSIDI